MIAEKPTLRLIRSPADTFSDAALLEGVAAGDPAAAEAFVTRHQDAVLRLLSRMLGAHDPAIEDLAQATLLAALNRAQTYNGRATARTWLLGIAINKYRMEIRTRSRRRRAQSLLATFRLVAPPSISPTEETRQTGQRIQQALETLNASHRAAFVLCEIEQLTAKEAGDVLNKPAGTVRRWCSEARNKLRPLLTDLMPERDRS